nr:RNA-dependent RNA polymerase [Bombyx mori Macula-like virus]
MAFTNLVDTLANTIHRDAITAPLVETAISNFRHKLQLYPYQVNSKLIPLLNQLGIGVTSYGTSPHPHAAHKAIETHLLFEHWNHLARVPSTVMYMKPEKFQKLQQLNPNFASLINFRHTPKDITRYPVSNPHPVETEVAFMHDALMFITPSQILGLFRDSPSMTSLYCSLIVPAEAAYGVPSLFPDLYSYTIKDDQLVYTLEGNATGNYTQPLRSLDWLRRSGISSGDLHLSVTLLESFVSVHSLLITRVPQPPPSGEHVFLTPPASLLPNPEGLELPIKSRLVPTEVYNSLFTYVRAVRTLRVTDPSGFVRTQRQKPEHSWVQSSAWDNLANFALLTCSARPSLEYGFCYSSYKLLSLWIVRTLRSISAYHTGSLLTIPILHHLSPYQLCYRTHTFRWLPTHLDFHKTLPSLIHRAFASITGRYLTNSPEFPTSTFSINHLLQPFGKSLQKFPCHSLVIRPNPASFIVRCSTLLQRRWLLLGLSALTGVWAYYHLRRGNSPQEKSDAYLSYFHPDPWRLTIRTSNVMAIPHSFFPDSGYSTPSPSRPPSSDPIVIEQPSSNVSKHHQVQNQAHLTPAHPETPPSPSKQEIKSGETLATGFPNVATLSGPSEASKPDAPPTPLSSDPTAHGPILPHKELFGISSPDHECTFLNRKRLNVSTLPFPAQPCLLVAFAQASNSTPQRVWDHLCTLFPDSLLDGPLERSQGFSSEHLEALAWSLNYRVSYRHGEHLNTIGPDDAPLLSLIYTGDGSIGHWAADESPLSPPLSPIRGSAKALNSFASTAIRFRDSHGNLLPFRQVHEYKLCKPRAKNLASNMKNETDGVIQSSLRAASSDPTFFHRLDQRADFAPRVSVQLIHITGFPGCGKTFPVTQLLKTKAFKGQYRVAVPTTELRSEWKDHMKLPSSDVWRVSTWETSLMKSAPVLVIDEVYKMPRGFLDLALVADPALQFVILLGDPCQTVYSSVNPDSSNYRLISEVEHLKPYRDFYCHWTHRLPLRLARFFGVSTTNPQEGFIGRRDNPHKSYPTLTSSQQTARVCAGTGHRALTFCSSQGSTFQAPAQIFVDSNVASVHVSATLVATTRSRSGVIFTGNHRLFQSRPGTAPLFEAMLNDQPFDFLNTFANELGGMELITSPIKERKTILRGGSYDFSAYRSYQKRHHRMTNFKFDPAHIRAPRSTFAKPLPANDTSDIIIFAPELFDLQSSAIPRLDTHHLPETRRPLHFDILSSLPTKVDISSVEPTDTAIEPVYPGCDYKTVAALMMEPRDPDSLEIRHKGEFSNQFPWVDLPHENGAQTLSVIAPKHDSKYDPTLLSASIAKRLRFRPSFLPYRLSPSDEVLGTFLFSSLCRAYKRHPNHKVPFQPDLFVECINLNEYSQLSNKTQAVIQANANRSDPDWRYTAVRIFSKTQHKINEGSIFGPWKACQTLALMHDAIVLIFGPIKKYQRVFDSKDRPPNLFVYGGQTPYDLSRFASSHLKPLQIHVCNDYSAFDQSQHGEAVVLERKKMERLSIPSHLIDLHCYIKTNITSQFGPLTCMRLTGEPGTYDDNTDYNIAVIYSEYDITTQTVFVSGDDSLVSPPPPAHPDWDAVSPLLSLTFKKEFVRNGLFCGYYLGPAGAIRAPRALLAKLVLALDDRTLPDKIASYLSEFVVGHSLGDAFWTLLPADQVIYQSALFDFFCRECSKEQKLALKIGEVPEHLCQTMLSLGFSWLSRPLYALLDRTARLRLLARTRFAPLFSDPSVEGVLQLDF